MDQVYQIELDSYFSQDADLLLLKQVFQLLTHVIFCLVMKNMLLPAGILTICQMSMAQFYATLMPTSLE